MPSPRRRHLALPQKTHRVIAWVFAHRKTVAAWFFMLGFLLITFPSSYKIIVASSQTLRPIRVNQALLGAAKSSQPSVRIVIPSLAMDLPVVEARVIAGFWELSETTASHGVGSANPGDIGNTVIFAHARDELFGPLRNIKNDAVIYLLTENQWYQYQVSEIKLVDPNDVEVIAPTPDQTLTLFTCSGFLDTKRLIVVAKPRLGQTRSGV